MGENLALAVVDIYGGHIWSAFNAIRELRVKTGVENDDDFGLSDVSSSVYDCLHLNDSDLNASLTELAKTGFSPHVSRDSRISREISERNIGGIVKKGSFISGFDKRLWIGTRTDYGLVPSRQAARLAIAKNLVNYKTK